MNPFSLIPKLKFIFILIAVAAIFVFGVIYFIYFAAPGGGEERFVISRGLSGSEIITELKESGFIKNETGFRVARKIVGASSEIRSGGYTLNKNTNAFALARELAKPEERWVVVLEGLRKEEIVKIISETLEWLPEQEEAFLKFESEKMLGLKEGVYFPDTYLISLGEKPESVAERMINRLNEKMNNHDSDFSTSDVRKDDAVKIASLIQREAGNISEMPLIAGIILNRLKDGMKLDVDATVQYARGDAGSGWWAPIKLSDKKIDSPYNTYIYKGLPPDAISNPGIDAILAVLKPQETKCIYYLHGSRGNLYCSETYEEHLENIAKYLK